MTFAGFDTISPELVWGLLPRLVGLLFAVAMASLVPQVVSMAGERGTLPACEHLARRRRDYAGIQPYLDAPTLLWFRCTDNSLRAVAVVGALAGLGAVYGGEVGWWCLLLAWVCFLSLDAVLALIFPWDAMLLEVGFLALFFPTVHALPELTATAPALPAVGFMLRWLVIRVMWGFAKMKFVGTEKGDDLYLKNFFAWLPVPNPLAWYGHHLPDWFLRGSLYFMFFAEVVAPGLCFIPGDLRLVGAGTLVALMLGIQATGNWGYFNIGYIALCVVFLDVHASIADIAAQPVSALYSPWPHLVTNVVMLCLFFASLITFLPNSWCNRTWMYWYLDDVTWNRPGLRALVAAFRRIAPFRVTQAYGVFPPNSRPPLRMTPVFEGSNDGETWKPYLYRYIPTVETQAPSVIAPHHPRLDHAVSYASGGFHESSLLSSLVGDGNPYLSYCRNNWLQRTVHRLLEGDRETLRSFKEAPFPTPPRYGRVSMFALTPTSLEERAATGCWWHRRRVGTLVAATGYDPEVFRDWLPEPETFHPDWVYWKRRSRPVQAVLAAHRGGAPLDEAVLAGSDLGRRDLELFWDHFVPSVREQRGNWDRIVQRVDELRARFDRDALGRMERVLERHCLILREAVEPHYLGKVSPKLEVSSNYRLHLILHEIVLDGRQAVRDAVAQPSGVVARAKRSSDATLLYATALLRWEALCFQICVFRWSVFKVDVWGQTPPGICEFKEFLETVVPPGEDWRPAPERSPVGEWSVEGILPAREISG